MTETPTSRELRALRIRLRHERNLALAIYQQVSRPKEAENVKQAFASIDYALMLAIRAQEGSPC